jgi:hypothetical protein
MSKKATNFRKPELPESAPEWWHVAIAGNTTKRLREDLRKADDELVIGHTILDRENLSQKPGDDYTTIAQAGRLAREMGIPVSRLVKATGGDRCMFPPKAAMWKIYWYGNKRYLKMDEAQTRKALQTLADPS